MSTTNSPTNQQTMSVDEWLKQTKLGNDAAEIIKKRQVSIEELIEFDIDDLKLFAVDLGLDTLAKKRFVESIKKLKNKNNKSNDKKRHVIVSTVEHNAISKLYEEYDNISSISNDIQTAISTLNEFEINNEIEDKINSIINNISEIKIKLLKDIDNMVNHKTSILQNQINTIQNYLSIVNNGKIKYKSYIKQNTINISDRKKKILKMTNDILQQQDICMTLSTAPNIEFDLKDIGHKLCSTMKMDDCDAPRNMTLKLLKEYNTMVSIIYSLHEHDKIANKKILEIQIQYAILPKSYSIKSKKIKKRKQSVSDSDYSNIDSDESDDTKSDSSYQSNNEFSFDNINIDSLKWETIVFEEKYHKNKMNKYKIKNLKGKRMYLIRIRARNSSGFGPFSILINAFPKCDMIWDKELKGPNIKIDAKNDSILQTGSSKYDNAFLKPSIKSGRHHFKFKIVSCGTGSGWLNIGIWLDNGSKPMLIDWLKSNYHAFVVTEGKLLNPNGSNSSRYKSYGRKCNTGDVVEMFVDLKKRNVKYKINGTDYGEAYSDIPKGKYRVNVHLYAANRCVKLKSYSNY